MCNAMTDSIAMYTVANVIAPAMADVIAIFMQLMLNPHWNWCSLLLSKVADVIAIILCGRL